MKYLKIWHRMKHGEGIISFVQCEFIPTAHIELMHHAGGFLMGNRFIPWHSICSIEIVDENR